SSRSGGVTREAGLVAFCPECLNIHELRSHDSKRLRCCSQYELDSSNFEGQRFTCPECGGRATHADLQTGRANRLLIAVEETQEGSRRKIRKPIGSDFDLLAKSEQYLRQNRGQLWLPDRQLRKKRTDSRPCNFGIHEPTDFFTERQLAVFGHAFY